MKTVDVGEGELLPEEECAVCLDELKSNGGVVKEMPCRHRFHGGCIEKWLGMNGSCPVCRYQMPVEEEEEGARKGSEREAVGEGRGRRRGIWVTIAFGAGEGRDRQQEEAGRSNGGDEAYWSCAVPGSQSIPWLSPLTSPDSGSIGSGSNSLTLGKHLRDENVLTSSNVEKEDGLKQMNQERCIWVPKTSRVDDLDEAAKSSLGGLWSYKADAVSGRGLFKVFQPRLRQQESLSLDELTLLKVCKQAAAIYL